MGNLFTLNNERTGPEKTCKQYLGNYVKKEDLYVIPMLPPSSPEARLSECKNVDWKTIQQLAIEIIKERNEYVNYVSFIEDVKQQKICRKYMDMNFTNEEIFEIPNLPSPIPEAVPTECANVDWEDQKKLAMAVINKRGQHSNFVAFSNEVKADSKFSSPPWKSVFKFSGKA